MSGNDRHGEGGGDESPKSPTPSFAQHAKKETYTHMCRQADTHMPDKGKSRLANPTGITNLLEKPPGPSMPGWILPTLEAE